MIVATPNGRKEDDDDMTLLTVCSVNMSMLQWYALSVIGLPKNKNKQSKCKVLPLMMTFKKIFILLRRAEW